MKETLTTNESLTIIEDILNRPNGWIPEGLPDMPVERTGSHVLRVKERGLTPLTRRIMERHYAALERKRKSLRERKKYTRKPGHVHPKKKAATRKRRLIKNWIRNPLGCYIRGYGSYDVDKELWDKYITPLWEKYDPTCLRLKRYKRGMHREDYWGTKKKPYNIYSFDIIHKEHGVVYSGENQYLFDISSPKAASGCIHNEA
jgi:hypothetical protein